ncbi:uncharacterized protein [Malus domestica]|uniref:uncharacterized protein n=1 Tax=Malus domestica TaxID=3750 RepID=UPI003976214D
MKELGRKNRVLLSDLRQCWRLDDEELGDEEEMAKAEDQKVHMKAEESKGIAVQWLDRRKGQCMLSLSLTVDPCSSPPKPNGFSPIRTLLRSGPLGDSELHVVAN